MSARAGFFVTGEHSSDYTCAERLGAGQQAPVGDSSVDYCRIPTGTRSVSAETRSGGRTSAGGHRDRPPRGLCGTVGNLRNDFFARLAGFKSLERGLALALAVGLLGCATGDCVL